MKKHALLAVMLALVGSAHAKDYGVQGNVWPITEIDIRQLLVESASRTDWSKPNKEAAESGKAFLSNLQKRYLPQADRTETSYFDPSLILTSDIQAPVKQADGSYVWEVLAAKGTKVNPLDKFRPVTAYFLFDGGKPDQVKLLEQLVQAEADRIVPVEAGRGDVKELGDTFKRPIFHASDALIARFQVKYLPSLVYPGTGPNAKFIGVTAFGEPYKASEVLSAWEDLSPTKSTPISPASAK